MEKVNMTANENFNSILLVKCASFSLSPAPSRCARCGCLSRGHRYPVWSLHVAFCRLGALGADYWVPRAVERMQRERRDETEIFARVVCYFLMHYYITLTHLTFIK